MIDRELVAGDGTPFRLRTLGIDDAPAVAACVASDVDRLGKYLRWPDQTTTPAGASAFMARFRYEGTARGDYVVRNERLDTDRFSLVGDELATACRPAQPRRSAGTPPRRRR